MLSGYYYSASAITNQSRSKAKLCTSSAFWLTCVQVAKVPGDWLRINRMAPQAVNVQRVDNPMDPGIGASPDIARWYRTLRAFLRHWLIHSNPNARSLPNPDERCNDSPFRIRASESAIAPVAVFSPTEPESKSITKKRPEYPARSGKKHTIAVAEEAALLFDRVVVRCKHALASRKGAHQHQQA
jgi:hypothetical protein